MEACKRTADTKDLILKSAKKYFLEYGYQAAPLRKIVSEAGFTTTFLLSVPADFNLSSFWNFLLLFLLLSILICVIYVSSELI